MTATVQAVGAFFHTRRMSSFKGRVIQHLRTRLPSSGLTMAACNCDILAPLLSLVCDLARRRCCVMIAPP